MTSSRRWKTALGIVSATPVVGLTAAALVAVVAVQGADADLGAILRQHRAATTFWVIITALLLLGNYALMGFLIVHAARNPRLVPGWKAGWITALVLLNVITYPIYWFRQIWQEGQRPPLGRHGRILALALAVFCIVWFVAIVAYSLALEPTAPTDAVMLAWAMVFDLIYFPLLIATIVYVVRARHLGSGGKAAWIAAVIGLCLVGLPLFWAVEVSRAAGRAQGGQAGSVQV
jgi:hypothetical protein